MIRKITLGLAALLSTFTVNALASPAKSPFDVTVPCYNGGLTLGLTGLYFRPSTDALDYGLIYPIATTTDGVITTTTLGHGSAKSVDPDYDWGYKVSLGYVIPCTGNDVSLTYTHFNRDDKDALKLANNQVFVGSITPFFLITDDFTTLGAEANSKFTYQTVDLDFGQHVNVGCNTHFRFIGGLRYLDLDHTFRANYSGSIQSDDDTALESFSVNTTQKSEFKGVGPRFGLDAEYNLGNGFGVVAQTTGALLVGSDRSNYNERNIVLDGTTTVFDGISSYSNPKTTRVIPNLTGKLGLDYSYQFCNPSHTKVTVEAGYQVDHFMNAADRLSGLGAIGLTHKQTMDVSFAGPYAGIQVRI